MADADKYISYRGCGQEAGNTSQGYEQEAGRLSLVMTKRLTQRSGLLLCEPWSGPGKVKDIIESKCLCHFCVQFLHFLG